MVIKLECCRRCEIMHRGAASHRAGDMVVASVGSGGGVDGNGTAVLGEPMRATPWLPGPIGIADALSHSLALSHVGSVLWRSSLTLPASY